MLEINNKINYQEKLIKNSSSHNNNKIKIQHNYNHNYLVTILNRIYNQIDHNQNFKM